MKPLSQIEIIRYIRRQHHKIINGERLVQVSVLFRLTHREHYNLLLNIGSIGLRILGLGVGVYYQDIKMAVAGYALASILTMGLSLGLIFRIVNISFWKLSWYVLAVLLIFALVIFQKF